MLDMMRTCFEWDDKKALLNVKKHGVSFAEAALVFRDPLLASRLERVEDREERWQTIGMVHGSLLLLVVHTLKLEHNDSGCTEIIRIISARPATKQEKRDYEHGEIF